VRDRQPAHYINCDKNLILGRLLGDYDYGDGRKKKEDHYMIFSQRNCNYPPAEICQVVAHTVPPVGHGPLGAPDYEGIAKQVMRPISTPKR